VKFPRRRIYGGGPSGGGGRGDAGRIVPSGAYFVDASGRLVIRKSISAFTLPKRFATGQGDAARRYLDWVASRGLNEVRAFARVDWTGPPNSGVESGWEYDEGACEQTLTEAAARGLRVELVAHTGRHGSVQDMANHLAAVDRLCLSHDNALLEGFNEPQQNGGNDLVAEILRLYSPQTPGWASGVYDQTPYPAGPSMTYHSPRKDEWSRCFKDAYEFATGAGPNIVFAPVYPGPVMLDEPPQVEQTIRDAGRVGWDAIDDWEAYGAGSAFFGCGGTMHGNPQFQRCEIPTDPAIVACVEAFVRGFSRVPVQRYHGYNRTDPPSSNPGSRRYHRTGEDGREYVITVRPFSFA
jgi:hypothetical protein